MTVCEMVSVMPNEEFVRWQMFHARRAQRADLENKMLANRR